jgi:hypothetical protein
VVLLFTTRVQYKTDFLFRFYSAKVEFASNTPLKQQSNLELVGNK